VPIFLSLRPSRFWWGCGGSVCAFLCPGATIACARARADAATSPGRAALWLPRVVVCFVKGVVDEETPRNVREYAVPSFHPKSRKLGGSGENDGKILFRIFFSFFHLSLPPLFHPKHSRSKARCTRQRLHSAPSPPGRRVLSRHHALEYRRTGRKGRLSGSGSGGGCGPRASIRSCFCVEAESWH